MQSRWVDDLSICGSHSEEWGCFAGNTQHTEFKAHLTSIATTAFCSDMPSHLVWAYWDYNLLFNRTMTQHTSRLCHGYFTKKESDGVLHQLTWPPQSPDNPIEMVWNESAHSLKEKQPTSAQHLWELLQDCWKSIPGEAGWENAKSVQNCQGKGCYFEESQINLDLFKTFWVTTWLHVLFQSWDIFTICLQCRK